MEIRSYRMYADFTIREASETIDGGTRAVLDDTAFKYATATSREASPWQLKQTRCIPMLYKQ